MQNGDTEESHVNRKHYITLDDFNKQHGHRGHGNNNNGGGASGSLAGKVGAKVKKITPACFASSLIDLLPCISILRDYNVKTDLPKDIIAGLTVGIMHVPQGMAYALLASIPPIYGLYVSLISPLFYFLFGTSRHISMGTFAVICLLLGSAVDRYECEQYDVAATSVLGINGTLLLLPLSTNQTTYAAALPDPGARFNSDIECRLSVLTATTLCAGLIQLLMWICRLGFVTVYLSTPLTRGLTTGAACHVFTSQVKHLFGLKGKKFSGPLNLIYTYKSMVTQISSVNLYVLGFGAVCIVILIIFKEILNPKFKQRFHMPFPIELVIVILGTLSSFLLDLKTEANFDVVGDIPMGLPSPKPPAFFLMGEIISDAFSIAIVSFAVNISLAKLFAAKHNYPIDANQELLALSLTNIFGSFFNCFYSAGSLSRSLICEAVGAVSQVYSLFSGLFLLFVIFAIGPMFTELPKCALAAIIVVNLKGMFLQFYDLSYLWRVSKFDYLTWIVVFLAVFLLDVALGLLIGFLFCLFTVIWRSQAPYSTILGKVGESDVYADINSYENIKEIISLKIFRFESALFFANCEYFTSRLYRHCGVDPTVSKPLEKETRSASNEIELISANKDPEGLRYVIIDFGTIAYIDTTAITQLEQIIDAYKKIDIMVFIAACKGNVLTTMYESDFFEKLPSHCLYVTVGDAVHAARHHYNTDL